jgi:hypothetical protein
MVISIFSLISSVIRDLRPRYGIAEQSPYLNVQLPSLIDCTFADSNPFFDVFCEFTTQFRDDNEFSFLLRSWHHIDYTPFNLLYYVIY